MKTYRPSNANEIETDLVSASPGDTIILPKGTHYISRIFSFNGLNIIGGGNTPFDTVLKPLRGRLFRDQGGSTFENFSVHGGGSAIEAEGHGTTIMDFVSYMSNLPVKLAGDGHTFVGGLIYEAEKTGIEINGGFYLMPELSETPIHLKKEIGLIPDSEPTQVWSDAQIKIFKNLYFNRNMSAYVENVVGFRSGFFGGMMYGSFIKAVPCAGGIEIAHCVGVENLNDIWNDFPSTTNFTFRDNWLFGTHSNALFLEGYVGETSQATIYDNFIMGAKTPLFVSAFPNCTSFGNTFGFSQYGKRVHGKTGNRIDKDVSCNTPDGLPADKLYALNPKTYIAHQVAHTSANYNFAKDELYFTEELDKPSTYINTDNNVYSPEMPTLPAPASKKDLVVPKEIFKYPHITPEIKEAIMKHGNINRSLTSRVTRGKTIVT